VLRWYEQLRPATEEQPPRVDFYLRIPNQDALGVKLREGRLETKECYRQYDVVRFHDHVAGEVELWRKWSFELAQNWGEIAQQVAPSLSWIGVRKERMMKRFRVAGGGMVVGVNSGDYPRAGCEVELTRIEAAGKLWWSLGLEAFGEEDKNHETLIAVARHVFGQGEPPALAPGDSYGYARWLGLNVT
jgi:hypothetical protein